MELFATQPAPVVADAEYHRLLGWPAGHEPSPAGAALAAAARAWYAQYGRPWLALREVRLVINGDTVRLAGREFHSPRLAAHLRDHQATTAVLLAASAGPECEAHARQLWEESRPDEYFFLEVYGSAVVEQLVAQASGRLCAEAGSRQLVAVPHYSPGYSGWDVAEQPQLFELLTQTLAGPFPGPLEVLTSGMLRPKNSLLAVIGLAPAGTAPAPVATPCQRCAFTPCQYRRTPHRPAPGARSLRPGLEHRSKLLPNYTMPLRALRKWAVERVELKPGPDDAVEASFRFDGSTCSNLGQPLVLDFRLRLQPSGQSYVIQSATCRPADEGWQKMCAALEHPEAFLRALALSQPTPGRRLEESLAAEPEPAPSGCLCTAGNRAHKWRLALETISFALSESLAPASVLPHDQALPH